MGSGKVKANETNAQVMFLYCEVDILLTLTSGPTTGFGRCVLSYRPVFVRSRQLLNPSYLRIGSGDLSENKRNILIRILSFIFLYV